MGKVPIILVFYNQGNWTSICIDMVRKNTLPKEYKLIVIDNGSNKKISENIKKKIKQNEIFHRFEEPVTMSFLYNYAVKQYTDENDKYFVILHNDVFVTKGWITNMVGLADKINKKGEQISVIYPRTNYSTEGTPTSYDDSILKKFIKIKVSSKKFISESDISLGLKQLYRGKGGLEKYAAKINKENLNKYAVCEEGSLFCTFFNRSDFINQNGFDESFINYGSEIKLYIECLSIDGYFPIMALDVFVHHQGNITTDGPGSDFKEGFESSHMNFIKLSNIKRNNRLLKKKSITALSSGEMSILAIRDTGIGDIIMSMFVLSGIKKLYPKANITYMTSDVFLEFVSRFKCIDKVIPIRSDFNSLKSSKEKILSLPNPYIEKFDIIYNWVMYPELFDISDIHRIDKLLNSVDIKGISPVFPEYNISISDKNWISKNIPKSSLKRIGIAPSGSCKIRSIPVDICSQILDIECKNKQIIMIDQNVKKLKSIIRNKKKNIVNLAGKTKVEQLPAILNTCDYIYTPDSGQFHIAGLMNTKCILFFGSIDPKLRDGQYPSSNKNQILYKDDLACVPCGDIGCEDVLCMRHNNVKEICIAANKE